MMFLQFPETSHAPTNPKRNSVLLALLVASAKAGVVDAVQNVYKAEDFDFRLQPGSAPVDRGVPLPNITDGFSGKAPDLGAFESGQPVPHYGPRR